MPKVRVHAVSLSLDGYMAGPHQTLENPLGTGGLLLHEWIFPLRAFREMQGQGSGGEEGIDNDFVREGAQGIGATVMGRNMFGPVRGPWNDSDWSGWWGPDPPFHHPVFVLTHHAHPPMPMSGGTTFYFVTEGPEAALSQALEAANGEDVRIGGGASTIRQYLKAALIDEIHLAVAPVLLGGGERLFENLGNEPIGYEVQQFVSSPKVAHYRLVRSAEPTG